jgi:hypothetical protein
MIIFKIFKGCREAAFFIAPTPHRYNRRLAGVIPYYQESLRSENHYFHYFFIQYGRILVKKIPSPLNSAYFSIPDGKLE